MAITEKIVCPSTFICPKEFRCSFIHHEQTSLCYVCPRASSHVREKHRSWSVAPALFHLWSGHRNSPKKQGLALTRCPLHGRVQPCTSSLGSACLLVQPTKDEASAGCGSWCWGLHGGFWHNLWNFYSERGAQFPSPHSHLRGISKANW